MTKKSKKQSTALKSIITKKKLFLVGILILVIWPLIIGPFAAQLLLCNIMTSNPCTALGSSWMSLLSFGPSVIGASLLSISAVYSSKLDHAAKVLIVIFSTIALSFIAYWTTWLWFWFSPVHYLI